MEKADKPIHLDTANPSRNLAAVVAVLIVFVLFLISLSLALAFNYFEASKQTAVAAAIILLPFAGLIVATGFIYRHSQRLFALSKYEDLILQVMSPDRQRRRLNEEVRELALAMNIDADQMGDLRAAYILAEDLALRQIEQENRQPLKRHIKVGEAEFDAVFISRDVLTFVEATFLVSPHVSEEKIERIFEKINQVKREFQHIRKNSRFRLLLALVTQLDISGETDLRSSLAQKFTRTPVDVEIRFFDFEELQRTFTEE